MKVVMVYLQLTFNFISFINIWENPDQITFIFRIRTRKRRGNADRCTYGI